MISKMRNLSRKCQLRTVWLIRSVQYRDCDLNTAVLRFCRSSASMVQSRSTYGDMKYTQYNVDIAWNANYKYIYRIRHTISRFHRLFRRRLFNNSSIVSLHDGSTRSFITSLFTARKRFQKLICVIEYGLSLVTDCWIRL